MIKYLCILALVSSPLIAYTFGTYFNTKSGGSGGNTYRVATIDIDGNNFKTYVEVTLANPTVSCVLVSFGALAQVLLDNSDILALNLSPTGTFVQVRDFIGDSGTNSIKKLADIQDWKFVSTNPLDPSFSYNQGTWKAEVQRVYSKADNGKSFNVKRPGDSGFQPVSFQVFSGACPSGAFNYGTFSSILSTYSADDLRPSKINFSAITLMSWIAGFALMAIFY